MMQAARNTNRPTLSNLELSEPQFRKLVVDDTIKLLNKVPTVSGEILFCPHILQALQLECESLRRVIRLAHNACSPEERGQQLSDDLWTILVQNEIDPTVRRFQSCLQECSTMVIKDYTIVMNENKCRLMTSKGFQRRSALYILSLIQDNTWVNVYENEITQHAFKVEAVMWRHFAQWRLFGPNTYA